MQLRGEHVIDIHARVLEGGDERGMRVFTFDARTVDAAENWMREICRATEVLELKRGAKGGWASSVSAEMVKEKHAKALKLKSGIFAGHSPMAMNRGDGSSSSGSSSESSHQHDDGGSAVDEDMGESPSGNGHDDARAKAEGARRKVGMGRGHAFKGGSTAAAAKISSGSWQGYAGRLTHHIIHTQHSLAHYSSPSHGTN